MEQNWIVGSNSILTSRDDTLSVLYSTMLPYLLECLEDLLTLAEMSEEQLEGTGHQWRIIVHDEVQQYTQEGPTTMSIQVQFC